MDLGIEDSLLKLFSILKVDHYEYVSMKVIVLLTSGEFCHLPLASNSDADHMCELHDLLHHHHLLHHHPHYLHPHHLPHHHFHLIRRDGVEGS